MDSEKQQLIDALKRYHDNRFTPQVYEHSIFGKAALLLERSEEVVRCDECIHYKQPDEGDFLGLCTSGILAVSHNGEIYPGRGFFCLYGERKNL